SRDGLWRLLRFFCQSSIAWNELDASRAEILLWLGNRCHHRDHQTRVLAFDAGQHSFHEADAGITAPDESHSGEVQRRSSEDEQEGDGVYEGKQGQPFGRVLAYGSSDSGLLWLLSNDPKCNRVAGRSLPLGRRSIKTGHLISHPRTELRSFHRDPRG